MPCFRARPRRTQIARVRHQLGLDRPLLSQFGLYVSHTFQGDFGTSFALGSPVGQIIGQRVAASAELIGYAMLLAILIGVPLAIVAALRPHGWVDTAIRVATTVSFAMPAFWLGLMLALIFGLELGWFPVSGYSGRHRRHSPHADPARAGAGPGAVGGRRAHVALEPARGDAERVHRGRPLSRAERRCAWWAGTRCATRS